MSPFQAIFVCFSPSATYDLNTSHVRTYGLLLVLQVLQEVRENCYSLLQSATVVTFGL